MALILILGLASLTWAAAQDDYQRGVSSFKSLLTNEKRAGLRSEWQAVQKHFEKSLAAQPKGSNAAKCLYFIGRVHEELGRRSYLNADRRNALSMFDRVLAEYPKHDWADDALFRKGVVLQEQLKDQAKAELAFKAVLSSYPKGDMAAEAKARLKTQGGGVPVVTEQVAAAPPRQPPDPKQSHTRRAGSKATASPAKISTGALLQGIRHWSSSEYTRVVLDLNQDVDYDRKLLERTNNGGKQLQVNLKGAGIAQGVQPSRTVGDGILSQIQVGPDQAGGALVTLDLTQMDRYRAFTLPDPYRVVIDVYAADCVAAPKAQEPQMRQSEDVDHVQAALSELRDNRETVQKEDSQVKAEPNPVPSTAKKGPIATAPAPAQPPAPPQKVSVSNKQKKYACSLVEQLGLKVRTIMIDPGHGGRDPGATANGIEEKDINLRAAKIMGKMLQDQGFEVHYTRTKDKFIPLEERTAMANAKNADLFISLHCNSYKDAGIRGLEVYYLNLATDAQAVRVAARENGVSAKKISDMQFILSDLMLNSKINESRQMAALVQQEAEQALRPRYAFKSLGSKGAFFYVLTGARMPSILVELGYLTNPAEAGNLNSDAYLSTLTRGLVGGVMAYKKKLERFAQNDSGRS